MERTAIVIALTGALFSALILQLAGKPKLTAKISKILVAVTAFGALLAYGYGYAMTIEYLPLAVTRCLMSVCKMFAGGMDFGGVSAAPLYQNRWAEFLFWLLHIVALYATASAAITAVGAAALRKLRLWLVRRGRLAVIFGLNSQSIELCQELLKEKGRAVVFVDPQPDAALTAAAAAAGCVVRSDSDAVAGSRRFLRSVGMLAGKRELTLYALDPDDSRNLSYTTELLESLRRSGIKPGQTRLVIPGDEDAISNDLQASVQNYGYGAVTVFQPEGLTARLLVQKYPPCEQIAFDRAGKAAENFEALLLGFGKTGQEVLRQLVMNGQFFGSHFRADVFAPDCSSISGYFCHTCENMLSSYDIALHPQGSGSKELYDFLDQRGAKLKYVVVCQDDPKEAECTAWDITRYLRRIGSAAPVYQCGTFGVAGGTLPSTQRWPLFATQLPHPEKADRLAMALNHRYCGGAGTAQASWANCDYFGRMSSRASADFLPAVLRASGQTTESVLAKGWAPAPEMLENMGRTEHQRWCAFHLAMGFAPMSEAEYCQREAEYCRQVRENGKSSIRIGKNLLGRTHACLVPWEDLDALSQRENQATGGSVDYKALDIQNVQMLPKLLSIIEE